MRTDGSKGEYLSMYFHIVKFPRASIYFSCLLFKFLQFKMF